MGHSAPYSGNGYDRYGYALNRPLNYTDASGFAIGFDPWLVQGYGEGFLDIYVGWFVGKTIQREREIRREMERRDMLNWAGALYAAAKQQQRASMVADRYIGHPALVHAGIAVDTWATNENGELLKDANGQYIKTGTVTFDFGIDMSAGFLNFLGGVFWKGEGQITETDGLAMVSPITIPSSPLEGISLIYNLRSQMLAPPNYNVVAFNCQIWAWLNLYHSHTLVDWNW